MSISLSVAGEPRPSSSESISIGDRHRVVHPGHPRQARYWIGTIPEQSWIPNLPDGVAYVKGQLECGESTGFRHWQCIFYFAKKVSLTTLQRIARGGVINVN